MLARRLVGALILVVAPLTVSTASADLAPPGAGCGGKKLGDDCLSSWKLKASGRWQGRQAPGRCVDEVLIDGPRTTRRVDCRPVAADRALLSDQPCAGKAAGQACEDFTYDSQGTDGTCIRKIHTIHGELLACDTERKPPVAPAAPSVPAAPVAPAAAVAPSKGCGCTVPGGEPEVGLGLVGLVGLVGGGRRRRGRG